MKAIELEAAGSPLRQVERPVPQARPDGVLIRLEAAPVLSYMQKVVSGKLPYMLPAGPFIPGSDCVGTVEATGADVVDLAPGTLVHAGPQVRSRGHFVEDDSVLIGLTGMSAHSARLQTKWKDGAFAEVAHYPVDCITPLDRVSTLGAARLAALPFLAVPYGGLLAAGLEPGETVIINGATGNFGAHGVLVALAMGAGRIVPTGRHQPTLDQLRAMEPKRVFPAVLSGDLEVDVGAISSATQGSATVLFDILGGGGTGPVLAGLRALRHGGRAVLMGTLAEPIEIPYVDIMVRGLTIKGNFMYPPMAVSRLVDMIAAQTLSLDSLVPRSFSLDEVDIAMEEASSGKGLNFTVLTP